MTLTTQFYTMLAMIGMGGWIGLALDTHGRFLKRPIRARWVVFINDFLFWIVQGLILFYILLLVNEGELRVYIFLAIICGYAAYQSLLKKIYLKLLEKFISAIIALYNFIIKLGQSLIIRPFLGLIKLIVAIVLGILGFLWGFTKWASQLIYLLVKILLTPLWWILKMLLKMVPIKVRNVFKNFINKIEGFLRKIQNKFGTIVLWWKRKFKK